MKQYVLVNGRVRSFKEGVSKQRIDELVAKWRNDGFEVELIKKPPSIATMQRWLSDGVAKATDGCRVEPDGTCVHGKKSWLIACGFI